MKQSDIAGALVAVCVVALAGASFGKPHRPKAGADRVAPVNGLLPVEAFASIKDEAARSAALFKEAGKVIQNPRCLNCHPAGDRPTQYDAMTPHQPLVLRGPDSLGATGMRCMTCHGDANYEASRVPGNPQWHLAPQEMAWQGKSLKEICEQMKDRSRNGGKPEQELIRHAKEDTVIGWGWAPGGGRKPAPGSQAQFGALLEAWLQTGGSCPTQ
jgi:hypothetical protein